MTSKPEQIPTPAEANFVHRPVYLIKRVSVSGRARLEAALRPLGLTFPQYACIHVMYEAPEGLSGSEIARRSYVSRQMIHRELNRMRELGWITFGANSQDRRSDVLCLTAEGRTLVESAFGPVLDAEADLLAPLSEEERKLFTDMLRRCDEASRAGSADFE